jgi:6,7-dimethyl-8-ribityllumazine synthase
MNQSEQNSTKNSRHPASKDSGRFAFLQSCWHREIVDQGRESFLAEMVRCGVPRAQIDVYEVPGAFEIPLQAKLLAQTGLYDAVVVCGFVVDGGIYRHEFVAHAVITALMSVQLEVEIPVISAVLTPQQFHEHADHKAFFHQHFVTKGREAASACLNTVAGLRSIHQLGKAA